MKNIFFSIISYSAYFLALGTDLASIDNLSFTEPTTEWNINACRSRPCIVCLSFKFAKIKNISN